MRRDVDRTELPGGSAYNLVDFIPDEVQAVTSGRGGWTYAGPSLLGATKITAVGYHPDTGKVVAIDQAFNLWDVAAATKLGVGTFGGGAMMANPSCPPTYHRGYLIFAQGSGGLPCFYKKDGTFGTIGSQLFTYTTAYKDHTVGAGYASQRVYFSAAGDPTTWDTTFGYWDTTGNITALATTLNSILIFHADSTERLRGTTPPPGSDMVLEPFLPNIGCIDAFSVAYWNNRVIWCASNGIFMSDGATVVDLTASAQMSSYWQNIMSVYSASTWRIAGGVYRNHYIVSINNGSTLIDCFCVSLQNQAIWRFTNLNGSSFVNVSAGQQEKFYMGQNNAGRVAELSSLWAPGSTVKQDGDGTNPTPIVETGMFRGFDRLHRRWIESMGKQKWRFGYVDYDLGDSATDNPTAALSYCKIPAQPGRFSPPNYTQAGLSLPATSGANATGVHRVRRSFSPTQGGATHSQMLGLKFAVTGPYAFVNLYALEGTFEPIEIGSL